MDLLSLTYVAVHNNGKRSLCWVYRGVAVCVPVRCSVACYTDGLCFLCCGYSARRHSNAAAAAYYCAVLYCTALYLPCCTCCIAPPAYGGGWMAGGDVVLNLQPKTWFYTRLHVNPMKSRSAVVVPNPVRAG